MAEDLNQKIHPLIICGVEIRNPSKPISKRERDAIKKAFCNEQNAARERLIMMGLHCPSPDKLLELYYDETDSRRLQLEKMRAWLLENQPLDLWFLLRLIEISGNKALERGSSRRASTAAKSKNIEPRAWVLLEWAGRTDTGQGKAAFGRQYAALVKSKFGLSVTPNTIERSWLPKG